MRDINEGDAHALLDVFQFVLHVLAEAQVERTERLVEQEHLRPVDEGAGDGDTLLLAAGEARHLAVFKALEADDLKHLGDAVVDLGLRQLRQAQTEGDVVVDVEMREEGVSLEHGVDLAFIRGQVVDALPVKKHITGRRRQKTTDNS